MVEPFRNCDSMAVEEWFPFDFLDPAFAGMATTMHYLCNMDPFDFAHMLQENQIDFNAILLSYDHHLHITTSLISKIAAFHLALSRFSAVSTPS